MEATLQDQEQLKLLPEIQSNIVTILLDLYLNELKFTLDFDEWDDEIIHTFPEAYLHSFFNSISYWVQCTRFGEVERNIDFNHKDIFGGNTFLHYATIYYAKSKTNKINMFNFIDYLLTHNATPNIQNNKGKTAFYTCMWNLMPNYKSYSDAYYSRESVELMDKNLLNLFLDKQADPNVSSCDNYFIFIVANVDYATVEQVIKRIDLKKFMHARFYDEGLTPIHDAAYAFNIQFLHDLYNAGADLNIKNLDGQTPLEFMLFWRKENAKDLQTQDAQKTIALLKSVPQTKNQ